MITSFKETYVQCCMKCVTISQQLFIKIEQIMLVFIKNKRMLLFHVFSLAFREIKLFSIFILIYFYLTIYILVSTNCLISKKNY